MVDQLKEESIPPFLVRMQLINYLTTCTTNAMVDSGADCNLLSHSIWQELGAPALIPSSCSLLDFKGTRSKALGELLLRIRIQGQAMIIPFQVVPTNNHVWQVLLGRRWMQTTNFQMDWDTRRYSLKVCDTILNGDLAEKPDKPSTLVEENTKPSTLVEEINPTKQSQQSPTDSHKHKWIVDEGNPNSGWLVKEPLLRAQGYGKQWKACWLPKSSYQKIPTTSLNLKDATHQSEQVRPTASFKWVPKKVQPKTTQPQVYL